VSFALFYLFRTDNRRSTEEQPAFYQSYEYHRGQKLGVIRLNPMVSQRLSKDPVPIHPRHLPMLVKPKPWVNYNEGGYLYSKCKLVRAL
jgi:DNA-directed RNA polymerase